MYKFSKKDMEVSQLRLESSPPYELKKQIGSGGYGEVFAARKRQKFALRTNHIHSQYAVKLCNLLEDPKDEELYSLDVSETSSCCEIHNYMAIIGKASKSGDCKPQQAHHDKAHKIRLPVPRPEQIAEELKVLNLVRDSEFCVKLYDAFRVEKSQNDRKVWIVMELFGTSLADLIETMILAHVNIRGEERVAEQLVTKVSNMSTLCIVLELLQALEALKSRRIVHCDLKPGNILLSKVGAVKLCDFGISAVIDKDKDHAIVKSVRGSPPYMAPETKLQGQKFNCVADIWSLAVVMFNISCYGEVPYAAKRYKDTGFVNDMWKSWKKSNEAYIYHLLGRPALTKKEYFKLAEAQGHKVTEGMWERNAKRSVLYQWMLPIMRRAMIPLPKHGVNQDIYREDLPNRLTLAEFKGWVEERLKDVPELKRRHCIMRLMQNHERLKRFTREKNPPKELSISL